MTFQNLSDIDKCSVHGCERCPFTSCSLGLIPVSDPTEKTLNCLLQNEEDLDLEDFVFRDEDWGD
jgi:hypothetical protein